jgi:hypothetical protein
VSLSSNAGGAPSHTSLQIATQSLLSSTDRRLTQGGGISMGGGSGGKMQYASVFCSEKGLTFQVYGVGRQSRATVDISAGLFSEFYVAEQRVIVEDDEGDNHETGVSNNTGKGRVEVIKGGEFGINLSTVLGCLLVLGPSSLDRTTLCLSYDASEAIFKIELLEEAGLISGGGVILSNCAIPGMSVEDDFHGNDDEEEVDGHRNGLDYAFRSEPIVARARIQSEFLRGAMSELTDVAGAVSVTVGISKSCLELSTSGHSTECHIVIPYSGNHPEFFTSLEVSGDDKKYSASHARSYPIQSILSGMRGLEIARETCISMNANGMIAIQHQIVDKIGNGDPSYVDFIMGCLQEDYDMEQDDHSEENDGEDDDDEEEENDDEYEFVSNPTFGNRQLHISTSQNVQVGKLANGDDKDEEDSFQLPKRLNITKSSDKNDVRQEINPDDDKEDDSQRTLSQQLFGTNSVGVTISRRHEVSGRNTRRKLNSMSKDSESIESKIDEQIDGSSQGSETDFEDSIDVTATFNASRRRRSEGWTDSQSISSPQLMYGDTHLEPSDDEK